MSHYTVKELVKEALEQSEVQFVAYCVDTQHVHFRPMSLKEAREWTKDLPSYQIRVLGRVVPGI